LEKILKIRRYDLLLLISTRDQPELLLSIPPLTDTVEMSSAKSANVYTHPPSNNWKIGGYKQLGNFCSTSAVLDALRASGFPKAENSCYVMLKGHSPIWEDPENIKGGLFSASASLTGAQCQRSAKELLEYFFQAKLSPDIDAPLSYYINGVSFSMDKAGGMTPKIWLVNTQDADEVAEVLNQLFPNAYWNYAPFIKPPKGTAPKGVSRPREPMPKVEQSQVEKLRELLNHYTGDNYEKMLAKSLVFFEKPSENLSREFTEVFVEKMVRVSEFDPFVTLLKDLDWKFDSYAEVQREKGKKVERLIEHIVQTAMSCKVSNEDEGTQIIFENNLAIAIGTLQKLLFDLDRLSYEKLDEYVTSISENARIEVVYGMMVKVHPQHPKLVAKLREAMERMTIGRGVKGLWHFKMRQLLGF
jgi:hypothetical protein